MPFIESYPVFDFSGGVKRNASLFQLKSNELLDVRNIELTDKGRLKVRRGSQQVGQTLTGTIENSFVFIPTPGGSTPSVNFLVNNNASTGVISKLLSPGRLATAITPASTTVVLDGTNGTTALAVSGTIEIEGDLIAYTGKAVDNITLTGVTGITSPHAVGAAVHQLETITQTGTPIDGQMGVTYTSIGNTCIICGRLGNLKQMDSSGSISDLTDEPAVLFATNYRDRIYGAGDGSAGTNGASYRVSFSARGNGASWTTGTDFFDVFDQRGEYVTGFKTLNDILGIFKTNSTFTYDELELKQRLTHVGAYNHKVPHEINGLVYTFCPEGIFETNLYQARNIGEPVRQYWQNFRPQYDATGLRRVVVNTFATAYRGRYFLFIGDITDPSASNSVVLEFNTLMRNWTVHTGIANNFRHLNFFEEFRFGDNALTTHSALFGGDTSGKFYRLFDNIWLDNAGVWHGGDLRTDLVSDTGSPVSAYFETPLYDLTHPNLYKTFNQLRCYVEQGEWKVSYRVEDEDGISEYRPLGTVGHGGRVLQFDKDARGWRVGFKVSAMSVSHLPIFNGFIIENTKVEKRK